MPCRPRWPSLPAMHARCCCACYSATPLPMFQHLHCCHNPASLIQLPICTPQVISLMLSVLDEIVEGMSMNFAGVSACSCLSLLLSLEVCDLHLIDG